MYPILTCAVYGCEEDAEPDKFAAIKYYDHEEQRIFMRVNHFCDEHFYMYIMSLGKADVSVGK